MRVYDGYLVCLDLALISPATAPEISLATSRACVGFSLEEERVMQQSRDKYFPQLENRGINPVGGTSKCPIYAPTQTIKHLHPTR